MRTKDIQEVPVVEEERLVGLLSLKSILRSLQVRQHLQADEQRGTA
jgi:signal-transduction protein with cAMP-binding, CBS, and nucleotidyltransferase domain